MSNKVKITIDGAEYEVPAGANVLQACLDMGIMLPHFCYHEALGPVGACRLCAAHIAPAADKPGRLEMACMTRAAEGMVVDINNEYARNFRKTVIEDLMLNHPHDCPVCDEGGECMLQDMTVMSEHQHRVTRFPKRTWHNQDLGPLIHHEMNRCITCYRCTRYYNEYALGTDFGVFGSRDRVYFGRARDGVLESEFSGNLVDVCPTGVFTNKRYREVYSRPWDLQTAKSVCVNCSVGCSVLPGFRHSALRRIKPLENAAVNKYFMCDRGRYGGEFVNSPARLKFARFAGEEVAVDEAIEKLGNRLREVASQHGAGSVAAIGTTRSSLEGNAALALLMKAHKGLAPVYFASDGLRSTVRLAAAITTGGKVTVPTLSQMEQADAVLVIGGDITAEAPMFDLSIRQAIRAGAPVAVVSPRAGTLDASARISVRVRPSEQAGVAQQIAQGVGKPGSGATAEIAAALSGAKRPLVVCSAMRADAPLVAAAEKIVAALAGGNRSPMLAFAFPGANAAGLALAKDDTKPSDLVAALEAGKVKALVVLERNLALDLASDARFAKALSNCEFVAAIDCFEHATTEQADAVIPCVSHYQAFGTFMNYEGRAQRYGALSMAGTVSLASSEILIRLLEMADDGSLVAEADFHHAYHVTAESSTLIDNVIAGSEGVRVQGTAKAELSGESPAAMQAGKLELWPIHFTFGSDELSALSPPVAELAPEASLELNPDDAAERSLAEGSDTDLGVEHNGPGRVRLNSELANGVLGLPVLATGMAITMQEVNV